MFTREPTNSHTELSNEHDREVYLEASSRWRIQILLRRTWIISWLVIREDQWAEWSGQDHYGQLYHQRVEVGIQEGESRSQEEEI